MGAHDFLHRKAKTPFSKCFLAAGILFRFAANCKSLFEIDSNTLYLPSVSEEVDFSARFWVDKSDRTGPSWPKPYVRGLDHVIFARFGAGSSLVVDLKRRHICGRFSMAMAIDRSHWRTVIFEILASVLAGSLDAIELHSACVALNQKGMILIGPSQSGKSTMATSMTRVGFRLLSDDRTISLERHGKLSAYAIPRPLILRSDAGGGCGSMNFGIESEPTSRMANVFLWLNAILNWRTVWLNVNRKF